MLALICSRYPWLRQSFADGGYPGEKLRKALKRIGEWTIELIKRSDTAQGFEVLPRQWVVEGTFGGSAWVSDMIGVGVTHSMKSETYGGHGGADRVIFGSVFTDPRDQDR